MDRIRNFSIIAHVNHGKSTLSDRFMQICGSLGEQKVGSQILDSMDLEKERGITIKAQIVTLHYKAFNGQCYQLNFIDTPGHVDFSYEVFRSLSACEGALLVVDATQGIEAQTISNYNVAVRLNLDIILVLNKIDLPTARPDKIIKDIKDIIGSEFKDIVLCSAKTGVGVTKILESLISKVSSPQCNIHSPLQALIIDSWFNNYLGVVSLIRIKNGILHKGDKIKSLNTGKHCLVTRLGIFTPKKVDRVVLHCGEVGWLVCSVKNVFSMSVGDTLTSVYNSTDKILPSFKKTTSNIYVSFFPTHSSYYKLLRSSLSKLSLNDSSLSYTTEKSVMFGIGFRCGFLGLLHMDIIKERLKREYNLDLIITAPNVRYEVLTHNNQVVYIDSASQLIAIIRDVKEIREPIVECKIFLPKKYLGKVIPLCIEKRGVQIRHTYYGNNVFLFYEFPMSEVILDFFGKIKSLSQGYASLEYEFKKFSCSDIVCVKILINNTFIDEFSLILHRKYAFYKCREFVDKLQKLIPRQHFDVIIQASIDNRVIVRSTVKQFRKDVIAKCYGGDISRKKKLLHKQKEGKRKMKYIGDIVLPHDLFSSMFNLEMKH